MMQKLGRELDEAGKIPLDTYDILVQLAENGGRVRLRDLVNKVVLSQPGLSRKVARLEEEGLLERLPDPNDGRGVLVRMTRSGRAALRTRRGRAHRRDRAGVHLPDHRRRGGDPGAGVHAGCWPRAGPPATDAWQPPHCQPCCAFAAVAARVSQADR